MDFPTPDSVDATQIIATWGPSLEKIQFVSVISTGRLKMPKGYIFRRLINSVEKQLFFLPEVTRPGPPDPALSTRNILGLCLDLERQDCDLLSALSAIICLGEEIRFSATMLHVFVGLLFNKFQA